MEHTGMAKMFKTLEETGLKGFLESQTCPIHEIPAEVDKESTAGGPEDTIEMTPEVKKQADENSNAAEQEERVESENKTEKEGRDAQQSMTYTGKSVYDPIEIWVIKWVTHFLPKIDPTDKGKGVLPYLDRSNPIEEHYLLVFQDIRDRAKCQLQIFDQWHKFCTGYRLNKIPSMKVVEEFEKTENKLFPRAETDKREMKIEYRLLSDILAKTIYVKAGSFYAVTRENFLLMTAITFDMKVNWSRLLFDILKDMVTPGSRQAKGYAIQICVLLKNVPGLDLGDSKAFPSPRILTEKTLHRYVVINEKVGTEVVTDEPRVKKAPKTKAASKKRQADVVATEPVIKKKRATKRKPVSSKDTLEIMAVAPEVVPLQTVELNPVEESILEEQREATSAVPIDEEKTVQEQPAVEVAAEAGVQEPVDESVDEQVAESTADEETVVENIVEKIDEPVSLPTEADVVNQGISTTDDVDVIIEKIMAETAKIGTDEDDQEAGTFDVGDKTAETADGEKHWFDLSYEEIVRVHLVLGRQNEDKAARA
ncbi:hypothetical protein F511_10387 [Dorcoceras hygrometricum]|uniref:Uncharacterized protein n=1 Tax=Dorcoceras hygrometricum TaxID=472368 RepID=A0A2Z7CBK9_9LAMI|nr:hypothetical protein F511_10387 [Dorcoceras hygrometricum]